MVGLKRAGFTLAQVGRLKKAYQTLYRSGLKLEEALARIESEDADENTLHLVGFIRGSRRGICRERGLSRRINFPKSFLLLLR